MRILVITNRLPYPLDRGENLRIYHILRRIAERHEVTMLTFSDPTDEDPQALDHLRPLFHEIVTVPFTMGGAFANPLQLLQFLLRGIPIDLRLFYSEDMIRQIKRLTSQTEFDAVQIEHPILGQYLDYLPESLQSRTVLVAHDVDYKKGRRMAAVEKRFLRRMRVLLHSVMMTRWEPMQAGRFPCYVTVSDVDRQVLLASNPKIRSEVVPNGVDAEALQPLPVIHDKKSLAYVGSMSAPTNIDAVLWFAQEIFPKIRQQGEGVEFWIVGKDPAPEVIALAGDDIFVTGRVDDVQPYYEQTMLCVVPLRAGGGTRLKILEAMALGRPIVSTSVGCEGIEVSDGINIMIADTAEAFVEKVMQMLGDPVLRDNIRSQARKLVEDKYGWNQLADKMTSILEQVSKEGAH